MNAEPITITARLIEQGNGFSERGEHVAMDGDLYEIVRTYGYIETTGLSGNWIRCEVVPADWDDVGEGWTSRCALKIDRSDEDPACSGG